MSEFLGIRFSGCPNLVVNKWNSVKTWCLAAFSAFSVLPFADAFALDVSVRPQSCLTRQACNADENFRQEITAFVGFAKNKYPNATVPTADRLQRYACRMLAPRGNNDPVDSDEDLSPIGNQKMDKWLSGLLSYSFWSTQPGLTPYINAPVWWCFLDDNSRYIVTYSVEQVGASAIINNFKGLAKPLASGGAGFYVSRAIVTDIFLADSMDNKIAGAQSYTNKELVAIDFAAPGTTKSLEQYQAFLTMKDNNDAYPRRSIVLIQEVINTIKTVQWLGLCSFVCANCAPGTVCP